MLESPIDVSRGQLQKYTNRNQIGIMTIARGAGQIMGEGLVGFAFGTRPVGAIHAAAVPSVDLVTVTHCRFKLGPSTAHWCGPFLLNACPVFVNDFRVLQNQG